MAQLQRIEAEITSLPDTELRSFRAWFDDFDARRWDGTLAADISAGKLDALAAEALAQYSSGTCKPL